MIYFLGGIFLGFLHVLNPKLRILICHKGISVVLLLCKVSSEIWRFPFLDIILRQILLECLKLFGHLAQGPSLSSFF